jgi:hypothetical protein
MLDFSTSAVCADDRGSTAKIVCILPARFIGQRVTAGSKPLQRREEFSAYQAHGEGIE